MQSYGFAPGEGQIESDWLSSILQLYVIISRMWFVSQGFVLLQDNDPKHSCKLCQNYLQSLVVRMLRICEAVIAAKGGHFDESKV